MRSSPLADWSPARSGLAALALVSILTAGTAEARADCTLEECRMILDESSGEPDGEIPLVAYWITRSTAEALETLAGVRPDPSTPSLFDPGVHTLAVALPPAAQPQSGPPVSQPTTRDWGNQYRRIFIQSGQERSRFLRLISIEAFPSRLADLVPADTVMLRFRRTDDEGRPMITALDGHVELELPAGERTTRVRFTLGLLPAAGAPDI